MEAKAQPVQMPDPLVRSSMADIKTSVSNGHEAARIQLKGAAHVHSHRNLVCVSSRASGYRASPYTCPVIRMHRILMLVPVPAVHEAIAAVFFSANIRPVSTTSIGLLDARSRGRSDLSGRCITRPCLSGWCALFRQRCDTRRIPLYGRVCRQRLLQSRSMSILLIREAGSNCQPIHAYQRVAAEHSRGP